MDLFCTKLKRICFYGVVFSCMAIKCFAITQLAIDENIQREALHKKILYCIDDIKEDQNIDAHSAVDLFKEFNEFTEKLRGPKQGDMLIIGWLKDAVNNVLPIALNKLRENSNTIQERTIFSMS